IFGFAAFFVRGVLAHPPHPTPVRCCPRHRRKPIEELEKEEDLEQQTEPWMKQTRSWATAKEWCDPVEQPRRVDRESGQQRENEKDGDRPVEEPRVNRVTQQLAAVNTRSADPSKFSTSLFVEVCCAHGFSFRAASISSTGPVRTSGGSGCGSFGP